MKIIGPKTIFVKTAIKKTNSHGTPKPIPKGILALSSKVGISVVEIIAEISLNILFFIHALEY